MCVEDGRRLGRATGSWRLCRHGENRGGILPERGPRGKEWACGGSINFSDNGDMRGRPPGFRGGGSARYRFRPGSAAPAPIRLGRGRRVSLEAGSGARDRFRPGSAAPAPIRWGRHSHCRQRLVGKVPFAVTAGRLTPIGACRCAQVAGYAPPGRNRPGLDGSSARNRVRWAAETFAGCGAFTVGGPVMAAAESRAVLPPDARRAGNPWSAT